MTSNKKTIQNVTTRIDPKLKEEFDKMREEVNEKKDNKKHVSDREITKLIPRHNFWIRMRTDIIQYIKDKRSIVT